MFQDTSYEDRMSIGVAGGIPDGRRARIGTYVNSSAQAQQVGTIVFSGHAESKVVAIDGVNIDAGTAGSTALMTDAMAAAINAEPRVSGKVSATSDGATTVTVTARWPGVSFTLTEVTDQDNEMTVTQAATANATASTVAFGRGLIGDGTADTVQTKKARLAATGGLAAKVVHATPAVQAENVTETFILSVTVEGVTYYGTFPVASATTVQAIVEGMVLSLNQNLPASTVVATEDNAKVILTAEIAGLDFSVGAGDDDGAASLWTIAVSAGGPTYNIDQAFRGVALATIAQNIADDETASYAANSAMEVIEEGPVLVTVEEAVVAGGQAYLGVGSGHEGKWRTTKSGANYLPLPLSRAHWETAASAAGLAVLMLT